LRKDKESLALGGKKEMTMRFPSQDPRDYYYIEASHEKVFLWFIQYLSTLCSFGRTD